MIAKSSSNRLQLRFSLLLSLLLLLCDSLTVSADVLDSLDNAVLDSALMMIHLNRDELGFDKLWAEDDTFRLKIVEDLLNEPLSFAEYIDATEIAADSFHRKPFAMLNFVQQQLIVDEQKKSDKNSEFNFEYNSAEPFKIWFNALEKAEPYREEFYSELDSLELHDLIMAAPVMWSEEEDSVKNLTQGRWQAEYEVRFDTSRDVSSDRLLDVIKKLSMEDLLQAGKIVAPAAQKMARGIAINGYQKKRLETEIDGVEGDVLFYMENNWGRFVIGGEGDNIYRGDFDGIIDLGGNDVYRGRNGGALGGISSGYSILIDLEGDDYYAADGRDISHGAGFLGIGILVDRHGNDVYRSSNYSQGAGFFGIGILADHNGEDDRRGGYFMQGAGHCGVGLLIDDGDETSDDRYLASAWAQGFGGTYGYGMLYDKGGDDNYRTGGVYLHDPLLPNDYRSFSGGFGMGWRPRAGGGIGVLYDAGEGNDFYNGEVFTLGASYWYAIGMLIDGGGNDYYSAAQYGIGAGIHLALGGLYDKAGDDQYRSRFGVVGGTGHDLSVGMMVDGSGDDQYIVSDGWGVSLTNSCGLFIDKLGNDIYATSGRGHSFGKVRWGRGFAGSAIFLDLEGDDVYTADEFAADSSVWIRTGWGIGMDLARDVVVEEKEEEIGEITLTAEDSTRSVEELYADAVQWEVGSARETVRRGRKTLEAKGLDAIEWIIINKLDTRSGLELRAMEELFKSAEDTAGSLLVEKLHSSDTLRVRKNSAYLLGKIKYTDALEDLKKVLTKKSDKKLRNTVIAAMGDMGEKSAASEIASYIDAKEERTRITVISALGKLKDSTTVASVASSLNDEIFTVRSAAASALIGMGRISVPSVEEYIMKRNSVYPESGVRILGRIIQKLDDEELSGKKMRFESLNLLEEMIKSVDEHVRAEAVFAYYINAGNEGKRIIDSHMEREYSIVVKSAYQSALLE